MVAGNVTVHEDLGPLVGSPAPPCGPLLQRKLERFWTAIRSANDCSRERLLIEVHRGEYAQYGSHECNQYSSLPQNRIPTLSIEVFDLAYDGLEICYLL